MVSYSKLQGIIVKWCLSVPPYCVAGMCNITYETVQTLTQWLVHIMVPASTDQGLI